MLHRASSIIAIGLLSNLASAQPVPAAPDGAKPSAAPESPDPKVPPMPGPSSPETLPSELDPAAEPQPVQAPPAAAAPAVPAKPAAATAHAHGARHGQPRRMKLRVPPPAAKRQGAHRHDGFYLRFASGFSMYEERLESDESELYGGEITGNSVGIASVGEIAMGGTIRPGLVLGGGIYTARLLSGHYREDEASSGAPPPELDPEARSLIVIGPFLDYYPRPGRGLHFQGALGLAVAGTGMSGRDDDDEYVAGGGGIVLGVGYEWWVGDEWSLGAMARATAAAVTGEDDAGVRWFHGITTNPSLMLTLTYH